MYVPLRPEGTGMGPLRGPRAHRGYLVTVARAPVDGDQLRYWQLIVVVVVSSLKYARHVPQGLFAMQLHLPRTGNCHATKSSSPSTFSPCSCSSVRAVVAMCSSDEEESWWDVPGAVLIFLPGLQDIQKLFNRLQSSKVSQQP